MKDDENKPKPKGSLVSLPGKALAMLPPAWTGLGKVPSMTDLFAASAHAEGGSVAIGGHNTAPILNVNATNLTLTIERQVARELPSYLSKVVGKFSEDLSEYNVGPVRAIPPEVDLKLAYYDFPPTHHIITDYPKYSLVLEASYRGFEQRNDDARRMVRRHAAVAYTAQLHALCAKNGIAQADTHAFARKNAVVLVMAVVDALLADLGGTLMHVMKETAHLAVCLIVADAVVECEVLERPADAIAS